MVWHSTSIQYQYSGSIETCQRLPFIRSKHLLVHFYSNSFRIFWFYFSYLIFIRLVILLPCLDFVYCLVTRNFNSVTCAEICVEFVLEFVAPLKILDKLVPGKLCEAVIFVCER